MPFILFYFVPGLRVARPLEQLPLARFLHPSCRLLVAWPHAAQEQNVSFRLHSRRHVDGPPPPPPPPNHQNSRTTPPTPRQFTPAAGIIAVTIFEDETSFAHALKPRSRWQRFNSVSAKYGMCVQRWSYRRAACPQPWQVQRAQRLCRSRTRFLG